MKIKRLLFGLLVGCMFTFGPVWILKLPSDTGLMGSLKWAGSYVAMPGTFVGLVASGGNIDDINFVIADIANLIFYTVLVYLLLSLWSRHSDKVRQPRPSK
jgi:hypothetical protein